MQMLHTGLPCTPALSLKLFQLIVHIKLHVVLRSSHYGISCTSAKLWEWGSSLLILIRQDLMASSIMQYVTDMCL